MCVSSVCHCSCGLDLLKTANYQNQIQVIFKFHARVTFLIIIVRADYRVRVHHLLPFATRHITIWVVLSDEFPHMLFSVMLVYSTPVLPVINLRKMICNLILPRSHWNMTLEKIDHEKYFWSQLSITIPLTFTDILPFLPFYFIGIYCLFFP